MIISRMHKKIIENLKKIINPNIVDSSYLKYRNNITLFDNKKIYFSDFFSETTVEKFDNFNEVINFEIFNSFIKKLKKRALKKSCHHHLSNKEVLTFLLNCLNDNPDQNKIIKTIKSNLISQDNIDNSSSVLT